MYGATKGLVTAACSGLCAAGHYCPEGSTNATTHRCPPGRYGRYTVCVCSCVVAYSLIYYLSREHPGAVRQLLQWSLHGWLSLRRGVHLCDAAGVRGAAPDGELRRYYCGASEGSAVHGQLSCFVLFEVVLLLTVLVVYVVGWFVQGSQGADPATVRTDVYLSSFDTTTKRLPHTNVTIVEVAEPNSVYCPEGSSLPLRVRPGYYTVGSNRTTRSAQEPCPMGSYCLSG